MAASWNIEDGVLGRRMVLRSAWSSEARSAAQGADVRELDLNYAKGWTGHDYAFLSELSRLEALDITDRNARDVTPIHYLPDLRRVKVFTYCKTPIDFGKFPLLEECALEWRPRSESLFAHSGVKRVFINKCPIKDLRAMSLMTGLESLSLASPKLETLEGIEALRALTFLGIYVAGRLAGLAGVEGARNLVHLEVNDCSRVRDVTPVGALHRLQSLHLCNDGDIETFRPLRELKELEQFLFYESTNVLDGDLSPLKSLPKLRKVAFMDRKHYTHRRNEFPSGG